MSEEEATLDELVRSTEEKRTELSKSTDEFGWGSFGEPPEDWSVGRVKDLFEIRKDSADPDELDSDELVQLYSMPAYDDGATPELIRAGDIGSKKFVVPRIAILFSKLNISKKRFWLVSHSHEQPAFCSTEYWPLLPNKKLNLEFYLQYFNSDSFINRPRLSTSSTTNSHQRIKSNLFNKVKLPVPPLSEQRKIASVLYAVDQAIQKTEKIIDQTTRVKKGTMQDLYDEGIGHNNFSETEFGKMPDTWDLKKVEDVCEIGGGGTPSKSNPDYWGGDILWTTPKDFDTPRMTDTEDYLTEEGAKKATSDIYQPGSTMLVVRSGILRRKLPVAKIITPTTVNQDIKVLKPISGLIEPDYLFQIIYTHSERVRGRCKKMGTTVESIETDMLKKYRLKIPPLKEQKRIADIGEIFDDKIQNHKENLDQLQRVKQGLMQDLLSGEVRTHDKDIEVLEEVLQHG